MFESCTLLFSSDGALSTAVVVPDLSSVDTGSLLRVAVTETGGGDLLPEADDDWSDVLPKTPVPFFLVIVLVVTNFLPTFKVGSFLAAADVRDCKTVSGKSIPSRDANVAN